MNFKGVHNFSNPQIITIAVSEMMHKMKPQRIHYYLQRTWLYLSVQLKSVHMSHEKKQN